MTRRNPMNDRYMNDDARTGQTRKSASSAKPKMKAGESINGPAKPEKKKLKLTQSKEERQEEFEALGPRAREKQMRIDYVKWNDWRRRMIILSFVALFVALIYRYSVMDVNETLAMGLWVLPFVFIGIAIYISYGKQRPLGRKLGIQYGKEEQAESKATRKAKTKEIRREYANREDEVEARVDQKNKKVTEREKRRLQNKRAEEERLAAQKQAAQKTKSSDKKSK